ncbi:hypothetical protein GCM10028805_28500 [Spirosoma harenae]
MVFTIGQVIVEKESEWLTDQNYYTSIVASIGSLQKVGFTLKVGQMAIQLVAYLQSFACSFKAAIATD